MERIRLTPEHVDHFAHKRLINSMIARGQKAFTFSYHSSSLALGETPYVHTDMDRQYLLQTLERTIKFFIEDLGGKVVSASEFRSYFKE